MQEPTIKCPECNAEIKLTETLAAPMVAAAEEKYKAQVEDVIRRSADDKAAVQVELDKLSAKRELLDEEQRSIEDHVARGVEEGRKAIAVEEEAKAMQRTRSVLAQSEIRVVELEKIAVTKDAKLAEAQKEQALLLRKQRDLEERERELELTTEKKIQEGLGEVRIKAERAAEERIGLRVREKEETITAMTRQIDELKLKAEQGSQQLQGEVQELKLEESLREKFPEDSIDPVPKGVTGGDALQSVIVNDHLCGTILWESKRTKTWSNTWLAKVRDDQRAAKADIAIIVSQTLPKDMEADFDVIDKVWVCSPKVATALAAVLRDGLYRAAVQDAVNAGMESKAELVYQYLTGNQFKRRIEAIVEAFSTMKEDLDKEKRAITKQWVKREVQIDRVMTSTVGMYGDLQGIAGASLKEVEGLEMKALEA